MMEKLASGAKNILLYTEHISELKRCKEDIRRLENEIAALKAFQKIVEGSIEVQFKGGKQ